MKNRALSVIICLICCLMFLLNIAAGAAESTYIEVKKIIIDQSEILTDEEIHQITDSYIGKKVAIEELLEAVEKINQLYLERGYITARAILPPQKVKDGVVKIKLVEGRVGNILIEKNKNTSDSYYLKRISLKGGELVELASLEKELYYFNQTNDVQLQAQLKAGEEYGMTDIILKAVEPPRYQVTVSGNNSGREQTGENQIGISFMNRSVTGYRDSFAVNLQRAKGSKAGSISYEFPAGKKGARLTLGYDKNETEVISGSLESLEVSGESSNLSISFRRPLRVEPGLKATGYLSLHDKKSATYFVGEKLLKSDIRTAVPGFDIQFDIGGNYIYTNHTFTRGFLINDESEDGSGDADDNDDYLKYNGSFLWQGRVDKKRTASINVMLQYTDDQPLPSSEEFSLGGISTVRGYPEGLLSSDRGYLLRAELNGPVADKIRGFLFLDHGRLLLSEDEKASYEEDYLTGAGLGVICNLTENSTGKFVLGIPMNGEYESRIHFIIQSAWQFEEILGKKSVACLNKKQK